MQFGCCETVEFLTLMVPYLKHAFVNNVPGGSFLQYVYNWKAFFAPHMHTLDGISTPHVFLIRKQLDGSVGLKFKKWHSTPDSWQESEENHEGWLRLMTSFPVGSPTILQKKLLETQATFAEVANVVALTPELRKRWV